MEYKLQSPNFLLIDVRNGKCLSMPSQGK